MMEYKMKKKMICINSFAIVENKAYLSNGNFNALIIYDLKKKEIEHIERFLEIDDSAFAYHRSCIEYKGTVFFCPDNGTILHTYDTVKKKQKCWNLYLKRKGAQFACKMKGELVLFPYYGEQGLVVVDMDNPQKNYVADWWKNNSALEAKSLRTGKYNDSMMWSQCVGTNKILITDYIHHIIKEYYIDLKGKEVWEVEFDGNNFWITVVGDGSIYEWNIEKGVLNIYEMRTDKHIPFSLHKILYCVNNRVFVFPREKKEINILNSETEKLEVLSFFPEEAMYPSIDWTVYKQKKEDTIYFFCNFSSLILKIDLVTLKITYLSTIVENNELYNKYADSILKNILYKNVFIEEKGYNWKTELPIYLELVEDCSKTLNRQDDMTSLGEIIFKRLNVRKEA